MTMIVVGRYDTEDTPAAREDVRLLRLCIAKKSITALHLWLAMLGPYPLSDEIADELLRTVDDWEALDAVELLDFVRYRLTIGGEGCSGASGEKP